MYHKIAFVGTHSCGKSTRAKALAKARNGISLIDVVTGCPFPLNRGATRTSQEWIFAALWKAELEGELQALKDQRVLVCDRTLLDCYCYSYDRGFSDLCGYWYAFVQARMSTYKEIYWCRPAPGVPVQQSKFRDSDPYWRSHMDSVFDQFIRLMGVPITEVYRQPLSA